MIGTDAVIFIIDSLTFFVLSIWRMAFLVIYEKTKWKSYKSDQQRNFPINSIFIMKRIKLKKKTDEFIIIMDLFIPFC